MDRDDAIEAMENALTHLVIAIAEIRGISVEEYAEEKMSEFIARRIMEGD